MRTPAGKHPKLKQVKDQIFSCGIFGACSNSVLSPRTPPPSLHPPPQGTVHNTELSEKPQKIPIQKLENSSESQIRSASEKLFDSIPSSTQWDFALEQEGRIKNRLLALIARELHPPEAEDRVCLDSQVPESVSLEDLVKEFMQRSASEGLIAAESEENRQCELSDCENTRATILQPQMLFVLQQLLLNGNTDSKMNAISLLLKLISQDEANRSVGATAGMMEAAVKLLDRAHMAKISKHAIKLLMGLCLCEENRSRAVAAGGVEALVELLPELKSVNAERALATLELMCTITEGRSILRQHALAIPLLVNLILRVSNRGSEYAAGVLCWICTSENAEAQEMAMEVCAPTQLLLLLQSDCTDRARRKALKLLKSFHSFCEESSCITASLK